MTNSLYSRLLMAGLALLVLWLFGRFLLPLIFPFLLGGALALLAEPAVRFLHDRLKLSRGPPRGWASA
jgi:predicted PurR-regulated permease PerM